jgi:hypothetical protein
MPTVDLRLLKHKLIMVGTKEDRDINNYYHFKEIQGPIIQQKHWTFGQWWVAKHVWGSNNSQGKKL